MNKAATFETLRNVTLVGVHSEDYEDGFWDCYRQISKKFEQYFESAESYKPNKDIQPPPYQIVSER